MELILIITNSSKSLEKKKKEQKSGCGKATVHPTHTAKTDLIHAGTNFQNIESILFRAEKRETSLNRFILFSSLSIIWLWIFDLYRISITSQMRYEDPHDHLKHTFPFKTSMHLNILSSPLGRHLSVWWMLKLPLGIKLDNTCSVKCSWLPSSARQGQEWSSLYS